MSPLSQIRAMYIWEACTLLTNIDLVIALTLLIYIYIFLIVPHRYLELTKKKKCQTAKSMAYLQVM